MRAHSVWGSLTDLLSVANNAAFFAYLVCDCTWWLLSWSIWRSHCNYYDYCDHRSVIGDILHALLLVHIWWVEDLCSTWAKTIKLSEDSSHQWIFIIDMSITSRPLLVRNVFLEHSKLEEALLLGGHHEVVRLLLVVDNILQVCPCLRCHLLYAWQWWRCWRWRWKPWRSPDHTGGQDLQFLQQDSPRASWHYQPSVIIFRW